jgi:hypothetical protein
MVEQEIERKIEDFNDSSAGYQVDRSGMPDGF